MKILRVASDLYPSVVGGIGLHAHEMSRWQAKLGHDVTVFTSNVDGRPQQEYRDGYRIIRFKPISTAMGNAIMPTMLFKLLRERGNFDIIHAHSHLFFSTNLCALVRKLGSPPLVITNHGLISQTVPMWVHRIYLPTVARWTYEAADKVICYTEEDKSRLEDLGIDSDKIVVIHNGIDTELFTPREKEKNSNQILWIGRFTPGKGVEYLIDAFSILVKDFPELRLVMVGKGPSRDAIKQKVANLGLNGSVSIIDFVPNSELPDLYRASDVFVLPSLYEGVPRTILEAMACGVPVVCTELPQLVDIVRSCGLLVPARDVEALADAVARVICDEELAKKFGRSGRDKVVRHYSWEDTVRRTIGVYENLVNG